MSTPRMSRGRPPGKKCRTLRLGWRSSALRGGQLIDATFEAVVERERLAVRKRQELHQDHAGDAAGPVDPEVGVVDAAPAQRAGGSLARNRVGRDLEAEAPLVATV